MLGKLTSFAVAHIFKPAKTDADEDLSSSAEGYRTLIKSLFKTISSDRNQIHPLAKKQSNELAMIDLLKGAMALLNEIAYRVHCKGRGQTALDILKSSGMPIVAYDVSEDLYVYAIYPDQQSQCGTAE